MSGDHNQYQKDKSYLDFECPRCGHCCYVDDDDISQDHVDETTKQEHEPVAWISDSPTKGNGKQLHWTKAEAWKWSSNITPLYTTPPNREWVGLTALEIYECWKTGDVVEAVEAKLKEKNT